MTTPRLWYTYELYLCCILLYLFGIFMKIFSYVNGYTQNAVPRDFDA